MSDLPSRLRSFADRMDNITTALGANTGEQPEQNMARAAADKIERLHTALVTVKVNLMRNGFTPELETYIDEQLRQ